MKNHKKTLIRVAIGTTLFVLLGGAGIGYFAGVFQTHEEDLVYWPIYLGVIIVSNLVIWVPSIPAFRRNPELSAIVWAIFSPVVGLVIFSLLHGSYFLYAFVLGALSMVFAWGLPWITSIACVVFVSRAIRNEAA